MCNKCLKRCLEDDQSLELLTSAAQKLAEGDVPPEIVRAMRVSSITALSKDNGRVRGIVAGSVIRRLTCKAVAQQFSAKLLQATESWQYALSTRAGTDALAHAVWLLLEADP